MVDYVHVLSPVSDSNPLEGKVQVIFDPSQN